jgi:SNF family Na+-dependent transporter
MKVFLMNVFPNESMMITLGIGTMLASVETLTTSMEDFFPYLRSAKSIKAANLALVCLVYFLCGLILCTQAGTYWVELFDAYGANYGIMIIALFECISVGWFYGVDNFKRDLSSMIRPENTTLIMWHEKWFFWWRICWKFTIPFILTVSRIYSKS